MPCNSSDHSGCDHIVDEGAEMSLYSQIDLNSTTCLNAENEESFNDIFKPWDDRFDTTKVLKSDADEQLIMYIPFTSSVKLKSIALLGLNDDSQPRKLKVYINRQDVDFDTVEGIEPTQEFECLQSCPQGAVPQYLTKVTTFTNIRDITIFVPGNFGADHTVISYIGFKGEYTEINRDPVITNYEIAANPADHKHKFEVKTKNLI
ncbi:PITH domain-containing protein 1 [Boothiomyces macroporosus]|uniref:PITH domain-containing protein 1 n=1 Tax=Boothiomyces macroporosus TaxID=261099 RepID=A0AAD5Y4R2_9FUNG|nr:PITH domain-containing protein 1 [Boothiomyces macroporosus]